MNRLLLLCLAVGLCSAYQEYTFEIPNGLIVPDPSNSNVIWVAAGHKTNAGGGSRNSFGKDFHDNGNKWDATLCQMDSDGDGKTNGAELGDPNCKWSKGAVPEKITGLSHPGFCEPVDSEVCLNGVAMNAPALKLIMVGVSVALISFFSF